MSNVMPGLSLQKILSDVGSEVQHIGSQGSHELAAALFQGSAFVMYPRAGREGHAVEDPQQSIQQQEQEMGGREM